MSTTRSSASAMSGSVAAATRTMRRTPLLLGSWASHRGSSVGSATSSTSTGVHPHRSLSTSASLHQPPPTQAAQQPEETEEAESLYASRIESALFALPLVKRLMALSSSSNVDTGSSSSSPSSPHPLYKMHRPYASLSPSQLDHHMTASLMRNSKGFTVRPLCFSPLTPPHTSSSSSSSPLLSTTLTHPDPSQTYTLYHLGPSLCGHPGVIHGGLISTLLDEGLALPGFAAFQRTRVGLTTRLDVRFRGLVRPGRFVVVGARRVMGQGEKEREGRVEVEGWMRYADEEQGGDGGKVLAEARAVFVEPVDEEMLRILNGSPNASP